jgi:hypothetical protein
MPGQPAGHSPLAGRITMRVVTVSESERRTGRLLAYVAAALFFSLVCLHALAA